jgi:hypothetical protein
MHVGQRVEIKRLWLNGSHHSEDASKCKTDQPINALSPENCFRIGLPLGEYAAIVYCAYSEDSFTTEFFRSLLRPGLGQVDDFSELDCPVAGRKRFFSKQLGCNP